MKKCFCVSKNDNKKEQEVVYEKDCIKNYIGNMYGVALFFYGFLFFL